MANKYLAQHSKNARIVLRVTVIVIIVNIFLFAAKLALGMTFDNLSVISDAVHSASDIFTSFFIIIAVIISSPKRDKNHNYGHEKIEPLMTMFFAIVLAGLGGVFIWQGIEGIINPSAGEFNLYLILVTVVSIIVKEAMFWYGIYWAKKTRSEMLRADAWHSRSDSLASIAVLVGLVTSTFISTNIVESISVLIVAMFILKVALGILRPAINQLIDRAAPERTASEITRIVEQIEGVQSLTSLRTRLHGSSILVDVVISVDGSQSVASGHEIARVVHDTLEDNENLRIKHCVISITPH